MNTARVSLCLAIMLSWALPSPALAQQYLPPGQAGMQPGVASTDDYGPVEGVDDFQTRGIFDNRNYLIRADAGDGTGYLRGFQTFGVFQPIICDPDEFIFWMSPRGYVTYDTGDFAGNLGAGVRWLNPVNQRILGGGFWWDHDNNQSRLFDQLGGSFEWLGNLLDFRANVYFPTNSNSKQFVGSFANGTRFIGHNIGLVTTSIFTAPLTGGDFETGGALPGIGDLGLRAYAGGYYYEGPVSGGAIFGVRGRLEALVTQNLWGTVAVSHDRMFGTNVTAAATIYLGTGQSPQFLKRIPMTTRLYQQMERQYRVALARDVKDDVTLALRAGGTGGSGGPIGTPIFVDHVDNTAPAGGDGSVEHPFDHLPTGTPANVDIIFVRRGDGTSNNMNQGITLNDWQRLLGDGVHHNFTSTAGTFVLPGFTPGPFPTITNTAGDGVTLASHNEVSGFNIVHTLGNGIFGSGITDFDINHVNVIQSGQNVPPPPLADGIRIDNATGIGLITDSTLVDNALNGVHITSNLDTAAAPLNLTVRSDAFTDNGANGLWIENNSPNPAPGNEGQVINAVVTSSTFTDNLGMGVRVNDINSYTNLTVGGTTAALGNTFTGNTDAAIGYFTLGTPANPYDPVAASVVFIGHNTISGTLAGTDPLAQGDGIFFSLRGGTSIPFQPRNMDVTIVNNSITTSEREGLHMEIRDTVFLPIFNINSNTITNNGGSGIDILTTNGTSTAARIPAGQMNDNIVTLNDGHGVNFTAQADTIDNWTLSGNQFNTNTLDGMRVTTSNNAVFVLSSTSDHFNDNGGIGVELTANNGSTIGTFGIPPLGGGPIPTTFFSDTINGNGSDGMRLIANASSEINFSLFDTEIGNNTGDGLAITTNAVSFVQGDVGAVGLGNNIHDNTGSGVNMTTNSQSTLLIDFDSNIISANTLDGVRGTHSGGTYVGNALFGSEVGILFNGSTIVATFENNTISLNGERGVNINFTGLGGSAGSIYDFQTNTISSNGQEGVFLMLNSGIQTGNFVFAQESVPGTSIYSPAGIFSGALPANFGPQQQWVDDTVLNDVTFTADNNTITNNGADGMYLRVATTGYLHAEVRNNAFGGNSLTDFRTDSLVAGGQTAADVITQAFAAGAPPTPEQRQIFLDNVARLDLRFTGNGFPPLPPADSVANVTAFGAVYTTGSVKFQPAPGVFPNRRGDFFRVEDTYGGGTGSALDDFNVFQQDVNNGLTTQGIFSDPFTGGYRLVPVNTFNPNPLP